MTDPISLEALENALEQLKSAVSKKPSNDLERDGIIQRYEYTFELSWKMIRKTLLALGRGEVSSSPRPLLREAHIEHWIESLEKWFEFLEARNKTSHVYKEKFASEVFNVATKFPPHVDNLIGHLKTALKNA